MCCRSSRLPSRRWPLTCRCSVHTSLWQLGELSQAHGGAELSDKGEMLDPPCTPPRLRARGPRRSIAVERTCTEVPGMGQLPSPCDVALGCCDQNSSWRKCLRLCRSGGRQSDGRSGRRTKIGIMAHIRDAAVLPPGRLPRLPTDETGRWNLRSQLGPEVSPNRASHLRGRPTGSLRQLPVIILRLMLLLLRLLFLLLWVLVLLLSLLPFQRYHC